MRSFRLGVATRRLPLASALPLALLAVASSAHADGGPHTVTLPSTGITFELPGGWVANGAPLKNGVDALIREQPATPTLNVTMLVIGGHDCADWEDQIRRNPDAKIVQSPKYLPPNWYPVASEEPGGQIHVCGQLRRGVLFTTISYGGSPSDPDLQFVAPVLESLGRGAGIAPPATTASGGSRATLAMTGITLDLPPGWIAFTARDQKLDLVRRTTSGAPLLAIGLNRLPGTSGTCSDWETALASEGKHLTQSPPYLPRGWHPGVDAHPPGAQGQELGFCANLPNSAPLVAIVQLGQPSDSEYAAMQSMLERIATAAGVVMPPPPAPPPPPASTAAVAVAPPPAAPTPPPPPPSYTPPPPPPPPPSDEGSDDSGLSRSEALDHIGPRADFGLSYAKPNAGSRRSGIAATVGIDVTYQDFSDVFSFLGDAGGSLGFSTTQNLPFDVHGALGFALHLGPFTLGPLLGVGIDGLAGGSDDAYKAPAAFYWSAAAHAMISIGSWGIMGTGSRLARGSIVLDPDSAVPLEYRIDARVYKVTEGGHALSLGFQMQDYRDGKALGAVFGYGL